jgi:transposase InsO family protein
MAKDVMQFIKSCRICQESKSPPNFHANRAPLQPLEVPDAPNYRVHMDLFSVPRRSNDGNKHVLVITDAFSKWVELVACPDKEAKTIASGFFNRWVCRYSVPRQIVTDRGREFCNQLVEELTTLLGTTHKKTSAYHPQTNTSAESFNRTLIKILATTMDNPDGDWEALLPIVVS